MISEIEYSVTFPQTGRTLARHVRFDAGMTAITGPNEAGKSYIIEMIRFCFFGSAALRGAADDYKTLKATMTFIVRGVTYRVQRKAGNAKIYVSGEPIAVGVKPVNAKILSILGFGLDVFDVACVTNQGEVERLGNMKPAERKRMVDQVIGLDRIDDVTKWCSEQGTFLGREIAVLERGLVEPMLVVEPEDYQPSSVTETEVKDVRILWDEHNQLKGWLSAIQREPVAPQDPQTPPVVELEAQVTAYNEWFSEQRRVKALPVVDYDPEALRLAWADYDLWVTRAAFVKAHPMPVMSADYVCAAQDQLDLYEKWLPLDRQLKQLEAGQATTCPHCQTQFLLAHEAVDHIRQQIEVMGPVVIPREERAVLTVHARHIADWLDPATLARWEELKDVQHRAEPAMPRSKINVPANAITTTQRDLMLAAPQPPDVRVQLAARKVYEADKAVFDRESANYAAWKVVHDVKQARLTELLGVSDQLQAAQTRLTAALTYESNLAAYETLKAAYDARLLEVTGKREELLGWKDARAFLADLRTRIKTYLIPSLSKVASHLLSQMTGGQRSSIIVDEDFEVMVDGQALGTLSGSGKACANLALRIGLGQVLTNNVLSLFIGDEIDASMDEDRADFTQGSLQSLVNRISQILIITHKVPTADHVVTFTWAH